MSDDETRSPKQYASVEEYALRVQSALGKTPGALCSRFGPTHPLTLAIVELYSEACSIVQQSAMQREQAETSFDLGELAKIVNPDVASHSETPFEND